MLYKVDFTTLIANNLNNMCMVLQGISFANRVLSENFELNKAQTWEPLLDRDPSGPLSHLHNNVY